MLISNPDLINSCRVCRSPNQDGDYECLYETSTYGEQPKLGEAGRLYENLLDITLDSLNCYPQFLCNSCDLQMKLFKKLKDKALKTLEYLQNLYENRDIETKKDIINLAFEAIDDVYTTNEAEEQAIDIGNEQYTEQEMEMNIGLQEEDINIIDINNVEESEENTNIINIGVQEEDTNCNFGIQAEEANINIGIQEDTNMTFGMQTEEANINIGVQEENINIINNGIQENEQQEIRIFNNEDQDKEVYYQHPLESQLYHNEQYEETNMMATIAVEKQMYVVIKEQQQQVNVANKSHEDLQAFTEEIDVENLSPTTNLNEECHHRSSSIVSYENPYNDNENDFFEIKLESQDGSAIDKSDYVTEIYELMEDDVKPEEFSSTVTEILQDEDYVSNKAESSIAFTDVEYVESIFMESNDEDMTDGIKELNPPKKRKYTKRTKTIIKPDKKKHYNCGPCNEEFGTLQEYNQHRSLIHDEKFPCKICYKLFNSQPALCTHMKIHTRKPIECEICQRKFNQMAHYRYHMNRHNNIRNFQCNICDNAYISKADLNVHMRFHSGKRPYVCNICGKDYLLMEHLKAHSIKHTDQTFQCDLCQNKFANHKTLNQHIKTIHTDKPRFKCRICLKKFRRKHHLEYHSKLHHKDIILLDDNQYDLIDGDDVPEKANDDDDEDDEYRADNPDIVDQVDFVADSGFVALNEDDILM